MQVKRLITVQAKDIHVSRIRRNGLHCQGLSCRVKKKQSIISLLDFKISTFHIAGRSFAARNIFAPLNTRTPEHQLYISYKIIHKPDKLGTQFVSACSYLIELISIAF